MRRLTWLALPVAALIAFALYSPARGQTGPQMGIDTDVEGNTATELGTVQDCATLDVDGTRTVDVFIRDVEDLLAWEGIVLYDKTVIEITAADVNLFMGANAGSSVQSVVGQLPDTDGLFQVGAFDASDPPTPDTGSGVLARITVRGIAEGSTDLVFSKRDVDGDTTPDDGIVIRDVDTNFVGDTNGDSFFDGPVSSGLLAVGLTCEDAIAGEPTPSADGGDNDGTGVWTIVAVAVGIGAIVAAAGGFVALRRRTSA
jgi:hypothetical protein